MQCFYPDWLSSGLAGKMSEMDQLKVKGLIIGPVHVSEVDNSVELKLDTISQEAGTLESLKTVIHEAHRRGEHSEVGSRTILSLINTVVYIMIVIFLISLISFCLLLGISVVLDLTPNYKGEKPWFNKERIDDVAIQVKV